MPNISRRRSFKKIALTTGGLITLPAWAQAWSGADLDGFRLFTPQEQNTLAILVDTIIPSSEKDPGALDLEVDKFLDRLFRDCYEEDIQKNIQIQLGNLQSEARNKFNKSFDDCNQTEQAQLFLAMMDSEDEAQSDFHKLIKRETIRGYRTSQVVMTKYHGYLVAPGHYYGCVDVIS